MTFLLGGCHRVAQSVTRLARQDDKAPRPDLVMVRRLHGCSQQCFDQSTRQRIGFDMVLGMSTMDCFDYIHLSSVLLIEL